MSIVWTLPAHYQTIKLVVGTSWYCDRFLNFVYAVLPNRTADRTRKITRTVAGHVFGCSRSGGIRVALKGMSSFIMMDRSSSSLASSVLDPPAASAFVSSVAAFKKRESWLAPAKEAGEECILDSSLASHVPDRNIDNNNRCTMDWFIMMVASERDCIEKRQPNLLYVDGMQSRVTVQTIVVLEYCTGCGCTCTKQFHSQFPLLLSRVLPSVVISQTMDHGNRE
jgi:hypothetical protein